jgi:DNA-binding response OmpR family regulator
MLRFMRILVIEDDPTVGQYVKRGLEEQRWSVDLVTDGEEGESRAGSEAYDLVVLDMRLPGKSGLEVLHSLRGRGFERPVLVLTAQDAVDSKVTALRAGADDYVTKPFAFEEFLARVEALARRPGKRGEETVYRVADLELNRLSHEVSRAGQELQLQPREFRLLEYLMRHAGQVVTRTMLLENVWDYHFDPQTNVIDVHISRLRSKIDKGFTPPLLHTVRGAGYMIRDGAR